MGYAVMHFPEGSVILGDERGVNQAYRDAGKPYYDERTGRQVTQAEIDELNKRG